MYSRDSPYASSSDDSSDDSDFPSIDSDEEFHPTNQMVRHQPTYSDRWYSEPSRYENPTPTTAHISHVDNFNVLNYNNPSTNQNQYQGTSTQPSTHRCPCCHQTVNSDHEDIFPEKCWKHRKCLKKNGWVVHFEDRTHTKCPLLDCEKADADFGTPQRLKQHWINKHDDKCWYWETKRNLFGKERVKLVKLK